MSNINYPFDSRLEHRALGAAALTATATLDTIDQRAAMRTMFMTKIVAETVKISANNELYKVVVELSNDDFSTLVVAAQTDFGATEVRQSGAPDSAALDEMELYWATQVGDVSYDKARIRMIASGTSPSIVMGCYSSIMPNG